jgi:hypothetical protein
MARRTRKRSRRSKRLRGGSSYMAKLNAAAACLKNQTNAFAPIKTGTAAASKVVGPIAKTQSGGSKFGDINANFPFGDIAPLSESSTANCDVPRKAYLGQVNKGVGGRRRTRRTRTRRTRTRRTRTRRTRRGLKGGSYIPGYKTTPTWKNVIAQSNQPGLRNETISAVRAGDKKFSAFVKPFRTIGPGHPANIYGDLQAYNFPGVSSSAFSGGRRRRKSKGKKKRKSKGKRRSKGRSQGRCGSKRRSKRSCSSCQ